MEILLKEVNKKIEKSKYKEKLSPENIETLKSKYPFNKFEYIFCHLISEGLISIEEYNQLRNEYLNRNKYLHVFEINAPRTFGETWAQSFLKSKVKELEKPSKELDPSYDGEYDFWYKGIKIEVKASRAVKRESGKSLVEKALSSDSKSEFDMNFQQIKPLCCDVFVWIGVWTDEIRYWVLSSDEVKSNEYFSKGQHRGNKGEGQLWIKETNIDEFDKYMVEEKDLLKKIVEKSKKKDEPSI